VKAGGKSRWRLATALQLPQMKLQLENWENVTASIGVHIAPREMQLQNLAVVERRPISECIGEFLTAVNQFFNAFHKLHGRSQSRLIHDATQAALWFCHPDRSGPAFSCVRSVHAWARSGRAVAQSQLNHERCTNRTACPPPD